ncbi:MAG: hypothetical protein JXR95_07710 [Deltaproteobacteria bacterium]|nr:hypothetical protein [Deltaproteobacteria bacterium]
MRFIILFLLFLSSCKSEKTKIIRHDGKLLLKLEKNTRQKCTDKKKYFEDLDNDGYGNTDKSVESCLPPDNFVSISGDCDDNDYRAHPRQTEYFSIPRKNGSFDFDCDGKETPRLIVRAFCEVSSSKKGCNLASGWDIKPSKKIPGCGVPENWAWNECRKELLDSKTVDATKLTVENAAVPPPTRAVYNCWSGHLKWKKRQLCR